MKNRIILIITLFLIPIFLLAQENNPIACSDGIDNDGDGLIDCLDSDCLALSIITNGCSTCMNDGLSFADTVIASEITCSTNIYTNPQEAIGISNSIEPEDGNYISLGEGGSITLGFTNNLLVNSGDSNPDVWVFETGPRVETSRIELRPFDQSTTDILIAEGILDSDADGFFEFGGIANLTPSLDIDEIVSGYTFLDLKFNAIQITDVVTGECGGPVPGADIDAVCALSSVSFDCAGVPNGMAIIDSCGVCIEPSDPNFNQSCLDCTGMLNGNLVLDDCGVCLETNDPNFNQSCIDCAGTPNGMAIIDSCGICLDSASLDFNQSCLDCTGVLNGSLVLDDCGVCLEANDSNFNQSCLDCAGVPNGTAILDSCGICLELASPDFNQSCSDCAGTLNGTSVIDSCGLCLEPANPNFNQSCSDCAGVINGTMVIDVCGVCLEQNDPNFNQSCTEKNKVYIPNIFSPNDDGINDTFQIFKDTKVDATIQKYLIYNRWGSLLYEANNFEFDSNTNWWNGKFRGEKIDIGVYVYFIEVRFENNEIKNYGGSITIL